MSVAERARIPVERLRGHAAAAVRVLAAQEAERRNPWDARSAAGRLAARERLAANPEQFVGELKDRLESEPVGTVMMVRALGLHGRFEVELLGLLGQEEGAERLAPTVLAALGGLGTPGARLAVDAHLRDSRERARANAVEALARQSRMGGRGDRRADALVEFKGDPEHRVRANAIRGLFSRGRLFGEAGMVMEEPVAFDALGAMLCDDRPAHRVAAIWVAGRVLLSSSPSGRRWAEIAGRITDLARSDPDAGARARAARAASRVTAGLREGWTASAADTGLGAGRAA
jgi:hypothetical protein